MAAASRFGRMPDGTEIEEVTISAGDLSANIITLGAVIRDIRLAGIDHALVLGFDTLEDYLAYSPHFGAMVGRSANRIADGRFAIDGHEYQLERNEGGRTHLHGGKNGFGSIPWRLVDHDGASATLALTSPDGDEGYPGRVEVTCRYAIEAPATFRFEVTATTDAPTIVNLAQHSYFNLDASDDILDHEVQVFADAYTPVNDALVPTGEIRSVDGTDYDLRTMRPIRRMVDGKRFQYDVNMVVAMEQAAEPRPVARLHSPKNGVTLAVHSTEPGVQFYDGNMMKTIPVPGLDGQRYALSSGCCFEPQFFPDAPNHPNFASTVLRPGGTYRQATFYRFSRD
ncbi:MAG: galactose mutarotase [Bauldia sp.]|nr:galactose mutarotase [Bauldia sp.]